MRVETTALGLLESHPPVEQLRLRFDECVVAVKSNSREMIDYLRRYYRANVEEAPATDAFEVVLLDAPAPAIDVELRPAPQPSAAVVKDEYAYVDDGRVLRKRLTGMVFLIGRGISLAVGPGLKNLNQVVNFINNRYIQWLLDRGGLLCHSAGVERCGRGAAIAGQAGRGKSTLSLRLLDRGLRYVSNDRLILRRSGAGVLMNGVAKYPRINPGTILGSPRLAPLLSPAMRERLEQLSTDELWEIEQKHDVDIDSLFGAGRSVLVAPLAAVFLLTWQRGGGTPRTQPVDLARRPELLAELIKPTGVFFEPHGPAAAERFAPERYLEMLRDAPVYELTGGIDFDAGSEAIERVLQERQDTCDAETARNL